jgi:hypothetical protein
MKPTVTVKVKVKCPETVRNSVTVKCPETVRDSVMAAQVQHRTLGVHRVVAR